MANELTLPELGEKITTATVVEVFVKPGDAVAKNQGILSLETDKAEFELPSPRDGTVAAVLVKAGDEVRIGQAVLRFADAGGATAEAEPVPQAPAAEAAAPLGPEPTPRLAAAPELPPPVATARGAGAGAGSVPAVAPAAPSGARGPVAAAPSVRRLARELGLRLEEVAAQTADGRVTASAVRAFAERAAATPTAPAPSGTPVGLPFASEPLPDFSRWGPIEIEEMSKIRRKTAENMARAWVEIPTVTHHDEADITRLDALRRRYAPRVKEAGGQLTWTAILLNVVAGALKRFPRFNASVDFVGNRIVYKKYFHIGVAVDTERGLLVPVIRDVDRKNLVELAQALSVLSEAARSRNIMPDMMQGATFTITNLGGIGGVSFNPIINPPQVAILGVSRAQLRAVWKDGAFEPRQVLPLALSYDHRVIDGADAARFLRWICEALEEPFLLDLEGQ